MLGRKYPSQRHEKCHIQTNKVLGQNQTTTNVPVQHGRWQDKKAMSSFLTACLWRANNGNETAMSFLSTAGIKNTGTWQGRQWWGGKLQAWCVEVCGGEEERGERQREKVGNRELLIGREKRTFSFYNKWEWWWWGRCVFKARFGQF